MVDESARIFEVNDDNGAEAFSSAESSDAAGRAGRSAGRRSLCSAPGSPTAVTTEESLIGTAHAATDGVMNAPAINTVADLDPIRCRQHTGQAKGCLHSRPNR